MKKIKIILISVWIVFLLALAAYYGWPSPAVEVEVLNQSPWQAGDRNLKLLPPKKRKKVYSHLVRINGHFFRGKDYLAAFPADAVLISTSKSEVAVKIYTNDPDAARVKKFIK